MPGRYALVTPAEEIARHLGAAAVPPDPPARWNVAPGQEILTMAADRVVRPMRWGLVPVGRKNARGRPVMEQIVNARSETVFDKSAFAETRRCVVPASHWYEWTGPPRRKTAWRIGRRDGGLLVFAAIWDRWTAPGGGIVVDQVATVTCAPNGDVRDIHDRMGVLLEGADIATWLDGSEAAARDLCTPAPDGSLTVSQAEGVDWTGP